MSEAEIADTLLLDPLERAAVREFKERSLQPKYISTQLKLFFNDCDRRSIQLLKKSDRYRRYSWGSLFTSIALLCASFPFLYWVGASEYTVARQRKPLRVKNFLIVGVSLIVGSVGTSMFAASNVGFGYQARAMLKYASAYDELAWEARKLQYQLDYETFSAGRFLLSRKLDFNIEDDDTKDSSELLAKNLDLKKSKESTHFSELLLKEELEENRNKKEMTQTRKEDRKDIFIKRAFEEKLTPVSIAYYEFVDKKRILDEWY